MDCSTQQVRSALCHFAWWALICSEVSLRVQLDGRRLRRVIFTVWAVKADQAEPDLLWCDGTLNGSLWASAPQEPTLQVCISSIAVFYRHCGLRSVWYKVSVHWNLKMSEVFIIWVDTVQVSNSLCYSEENAAPLYLLHFGHSAKMRESE